MCLKVCFVTCILADVLDVPLHTFASQALIAADTPEGECGANQALAAADGGDDLGKLETNFNHWFSSFPLVLCLITHCNQYARPCGAGSRCILTA